MRKNDRYKFYCETPHTRMQMSNFNLVEHVNVLFGSGGDTIDKFVKDHIHQIAIELSCAAVALLAETDVRAHAQRNTHRWEHFGEKTRSEILGKICHQL